MPVFEKFSKSISDKINTMTHTNQTLYVTNIDKQLLWDTYLKSFPEGTDPIYKTRTEHDCNCCKQFIRNYGNIVTIDSNQQLVSIWDVEGIEYPYNIVAEKLSTIVKSSTITNIFISKFNKLGNASSHSVDDQNNVITWNHFHAILPNTHVSKNIESIEQSQALIRDPKNVFKRSMEELTLNAGETILELIEQGSLYRGDEFKANIKQFIVYKIQFDKLNNADKDNWCWANAKNNFVAKIRNQAIGTLLINISEGMDLDVAVRKFEGVMAPSNYKRPNTIFTKKMVENAQAKIIELGFDNSLARRYAVASDITVNNVLFVDRDIRPKLGGNVFDDLVTTNKLSTKTLDKIEEVHIDDFITNILPKSTSIELMVESRHQNNLMSLIAPQNADAPSMLKWNNNFGWAYNGDITDSMKERVKQAGGDINGVLRFSIMWNDGKNYDGNDLDAHCIEPNKNHIYYGNANIRHPSSGILDVDIRHPDRNKAAVENITWTDLNKMQKGRYLMYVNNYSHRGGTEGFSAELEYNGKIYSYVYNQNVKDSEKVVVAEFDFDPATGIKFINSLDSTTASKDIWGIKTNTFVKVSMAMFSPNYWDDQNGIGNKHHFFILEGCKNEGTPRGFFNEFLQESLMEHKKVFEALGSRMRVEPSNEQLSGLGFSSTQRNSIIAKVNGTFKRTIKINF